MQTSKSLTDEIINALAANKVIESSFCPKNLNGLQDFIGLHAFSLMHGTTFTDNANKEIGYLSFGSADGMIGISCSMVAEAKDSRIGYPAFKTSVSCADGFCQSILGNLAELDDIRFEVGRDAKLYPL